MDARLFVKRNVSTILTGLGNIGVIATTIAAVKAEMEDGAEFYILEMPFEPSVDYEEY